MIDFLDPRQQQIISSLLGLDDEVRIGFFGGIEGQSESGLCYFPIIIHRIKVIFNFVYLKYLPEKVYNLEHRQVLGTLMSLGLKREKFGDILIQNDRVQFVAAEEIETYLNVNLEKVGKASVTIRSFLLLK